MANANVSGQHANIVKTRLDNIAFAEFDGNNLPDEMDVNRDTIFFKRKNIDRQARVYEEAAGTGNPEELQENEPMRGAQALTGNLTTRTVRDFHKTIKFSRNLWDDDQHGFVDEIIRRDVRKSRQFQTQRSVLDTYGDAFDGNVNTTPDGNSLASDSHTALDGSTVDTLETGAFTPDNLEVAVRSLELQLDQDGTSGAHEFAGIAGPPNLYPDIKETMGSELRANSAENNLNIFSTVYGTVSIKKSRFLNSTFNSATNANTSYHLVSTHHSITYDVRQGLMTTLKSWEDDAEEKKQYTYFIDYREMYYPESWPGYVGSNGTT